MFVEQPVEGVWVSLSLPCEHKKRATVTGVAIELVFLNDRHFVDAPSNEQIYREITTRSALRVEVCFSSNQADVAFHQVMPASVVNNLLSRSFMGRDKGAV